MRRRLRVYVAHKYDGAMWIDQVVRGMLESRGLDLGSTWHNPPYATAENLAALSDAECHAIAQKNDNDLAACDACLGIIPDVGGRAMFGEIRIAIAGGLHVVTTGPEYLDVRRPGVVHCESVVIAANQLERISIRRFGLPWQRVGE